MNLWIGAVTLSNTALLELKCSSSVAIIGVMVTSERLRTIVHITFQRSNKDPTCKFTLQDFLHCNQKLKDEAKLYISSRQWSNNRLLFFQPISDMRNPNNRKSFLQGRIKIFKIRMNQGIKNNHTEGPESVCSYVTLTGC